MFSGGKISTVFRLGVTVEPSILEPYSHFAVLLRSIIKINVHHALLVSQCLLLKNIQ